LESLDKFLIPFVVEIPILACKLSQTFEGFSIQARLPPPTRIPVIVMGVAFTRATRSMRGAVLAVDCWLAGWLSHAGMVSKQPIYLTTFSYGSPIILVFF